MGNSSQLRWRAGLGRELTMLMALKVAALALLWWLFFSPAHRVVADAEATAQRMGVGSAQTPDPGRVPQLEPLQRSGAAEAGRRR